MIVCSAKIEFHFSTARMIGPKGYHMIQGCGSHLVIVTCVRMLWTVRLESKRNDPRPGLVLLKTWILSIFYYLKPFFLVLTSQVRVRQFLQNTKLKLLPCPARWLSKYTSASISFCWHRDANPRPSNLCLFARSLLSLQGLEYLRLITFSLFVIGT